MSDARDIDRRVAEALGGGGEVTPAQWREFHQTTAPMSPADLDLFYCAFYGREQPDRAAIIRIGSTDNGQMIAAVSWVRESEWPG